MKHVSCGLQNHEGSHPQRDSLAACLGGNNLGCYNDQEEPYEEDSVGPLISDANENTPNPFAIKCNRSDRQRLPIAQQLPSYLLMIYATVTWLHLQFNLPRIAYNAVLMIITALIMFLIPDIMPPFHTL